MRERAGSSCGQWSIVQALVGQCQNRCRSPCANGTAPIMSAPNLQLLLPVPDLVIRYSFCFDAYFKRAQLAASDVFFRLDEYLPVEEHELVRIWPATFSIAREAANRDARAKRMPMPLAKET